MPKKLPMHAKPFHFKHFSMMHHNSTMKIGTDAVLLGRWVNINSGDAALDVGSGSGVIALMLAQRGARLVDAVDIDKASVEEAASNFAVSRWSTMMRALNADIRTFNADIKYDVMVSNPPYFVNSSHCEMDRRTMARHSGVSLSFFDLLAAARRLLKPAGSLAVVLPLREEKGFLKEAQRTDFQPYRKQYIVPVEGLDPNRVNIELTLNGPYEYSEEKLIIRNKNNNFTAEYNDFLKDFYLGL